MKTQELKTLIKESMREVLREERLLLCNMLMSYVSDEEQKELDTSFGSPQDYEEEKAYVFVEKSIKTKLDKLPKRPNIL